MSTLTELAQQIAQLYPLQDKRVGKRYRVVGELAGMTELEEINGPYWRLTSDHSATSRAVHYRGRSRPRSGCAFAPGTFRIRVLVGRQAS